MKEELGWAGPQRAWEQPSCVAWSYTPPLHILHNLYSLGGPYVTHSCSRPQTVWFFFALLGDSGRPFVISSTCFVLFCFVFICFYFWLCWIVVAVCQLSLVVVSRGYSSLQCVGFSLRWLLLLWSTGSRHAGFSSCGTWAQQSWRTGLVAPRHVGSSQARARTRVPCIGRQILNHCTTREALFHLF